MYNSSAENHHLIFKDWNESLEWQAGIRRIVHQVWDWIDDRRYTFHLRIDRETDTGWESLQYVSHDRRRDCDGSNPQIIRESNRAATVRKRSLLRTPPTKQIDFTNH